jgi:hypothetical protein
MVINNWNWCSTLHQGPFIFRHDEDDISNDSSSDHSALKGDAVLVVVDPHRNNYAQDIRIWFTHVDVYSGACHVSVGSE